MRQRPYGLHFAYSVKPTVATSSGPDGDATHNAAQGVAAEVAIRGVRQMGGRDAAHPPPMQNIADGVGEPVKEQGKEGAELQVNTSRKLAGPCAQSLPAGQVT
ncbi:hypothetical protein NDU88_007237 [Pleurodeles waltl]|uniref:Uncharacterized protein n=1 Tax=Pleurodeles waltl TaxID=8319 RepID=A0AAV7SS73_PLEWA|nr:hypothetical protein NDU88_007237 [Pleurodeles waltl]